MKFPVGYTFTRGESMAFISQLCQLFRAYECLEVCAPATTYGAETVFALAKNPRCQFSRARVSVQRRGDLVVLGKQGGLRAKAYEGFNISQYVFTSRTTVEDAQFLVLGASSFDRASGDDQGVPCGCHTWSISRDEARCFLEQVSASLSHTKRGPSYTLDLDSLDLRVSRRRGVLTSTAACSFRDGQIVVRRKKQETVLPQCSPMQAVLFIQGSLIDVSRPSRGNM